MVADRGLAVALPGRLGGVTAPAGAGNTGRMEGMAPLPAAVGRTADVAALLPARGAPPPALATGSPSAVSSIMDGLTLGGIAVLFAWASLAVRRVYRRGWPSSVARGAAVVAMDLVLSSLAGQVALMILLLRG